MATSSPYPTVGNVLSCKLPDIQENEQASSGTNGNALAAYSTMLLSCLDSLCRRVIC